MKYLFFLPLLLLLNVCYAQSNSTTSLTPEAIATKSIDYQKKANWYRLTPQYNHDSTVIYFDKALQLLETHTPIQYVRLANVINDMINPDPHTYTYSMMDSLAEKGWYYFQQIPAPKRDMMLHYELLSSWSTIKLEKGENQAALDLLTKALVVIDQDTRPAIKARVLKDKGNFYVRNGSTQDLQLGRRPLLESLDYFNKTNRPDKPEILIQIYKSIISFFDNLERADSFAYHRNDSAVYYLDKIKTILPQSRNPYNSAWYNAVIGRDIITYKQPQHAGDTIGEKEFAAANQYILKAIEILERYKLQYTTIYPYCFGILGDIAFRRLEYNKAIDYYIKTSYLDSVVNFKYHSIGILSLLSDVYEKSGNLPKALEYNKRFLQESLKYEKESSERGLRENELKIDVLGKEKMIAEKNAQRNSLLTFTAIAILMFLLLLFFFASLYRNYKTKGKLNTKLEALNQDLEHKNIQLDKRNAENELLLKEIHHRVKNNLEIVSGLLELQAAQIENPSAQAVMQSSQNRVMSMGIIHQKLYQKGNLAAIEMKDYFHNLGESILDTFNAASHIQIKSEMQPIELDVDTAVPIGLIANELICNSLKYAFNKNGKGEIQISLNKSDIENELIFCVADNGMGKPENVISKGTGFGTELVNLLVQQLDGKLTLDTINGTAIKILFTYTKPH
jgi:two-component system, sensor histidine kinase PdtaS